jgi:hypothetical protein
VVSCALLAAFKRLLLETVLSLSGREDIVKALNLASNSSIGAALIGFNRTIPHAKYVEPHETLVVN